MNYKQSIEWLQLFKTHSKELVESEFRKTMETSKYTLHWSKEKGPRLTFEPPHNNDQLRSALLTLRLFGQNNEDIALSNITKNIFNNNNLPLSDNIRKEWNNIRNNWNRFLDSPAVNKSYTRREIYEMFLYGKYAHLKPKHREELDKLKDGFFGGDQEFLSFRAIVSHWIDCLEEMEKVISKAIIELETTD